jgi:hypothetical protein
VLAAAVLALAPAAAFAGTSSNSAASNASRQCTALRAKIGLTQFTQAFPTFDGCISSMTPVALKNTSTATSICTALRAQAAQTSFAAGHHGKSFARFYGTGPKHANALANCVAATTNARMTAQVSTSAECVPLQFDGSFSASHDGKTFAQFYGTNADDSNALGMCVVLSTGVIPQSTIAPPAQSSVVQRECGGGTGGAPLHPMTDNCTVASGK